MAELALALAAVLPATALISAANAAAAEVGRIVELTVADNQVKLVFQADGLPSGVSVDPASVVVTVDGKATQATAEPLSEVDQAVSRTAVLAIDNSRSMAGDRLVAAKAAATTFLAGLPSDVTVGLVTFGHTAEVAVLPTSDRARVAEAIEAVELDTVEGTALFDAAGLASSQAGGAGARSVLLLTDGNEDGSSQASLDEVVQSMTDDGVAVDAVYIGDEAAQPPELQELLQGVGGQVISSATADLAAVFEQAALAISSQLLVTAPLPAGVSQSGNVSVTATAGGSTLTDSAFATLVDSSVGTPQGDFGPRAVEESAASRLLTDSSLPLVLGALFLGLLVLLYVAFSAFRQDERSGRVRRRLSIYTLTGRTPVKETESTALGSSQVARSAVELAGKVVQRRDFESTLALRLEAAGVPLRAAEWMLVHLGVAIGAALLALLLSGGQIIATVLGLALGFGLPYAYLVVKESRRTSAFLAQLPDTLQLIAGSLSAGYSMPQAMDTVVREGSQPVSAEFNRALVEARLGVPIEDAMEGIATRMKSKDFSWVVMAIRIQREVGGNLSELLTTVSGTLRERERLRRQVKVLSAEGRLSAWILGLLPIVFALYLVLVQPEYLKPLVSEALGWLLIGVGVTLLTVGTLWMRKAVRVEV